MNFTRLFDVDQRVAVVALVVFGKFLFGLAATVAGDDLRQVAQLLIIPGVSVSA